jgi:hypothetical protein
MVHSRGRAGAAGSPPLAGAPGSPPPVAGSALNVAVTVLPPLIVRAQLDAAPEQDPLQPAKLEPAAGVADRATAALST